MDWLTNPEAWLALATLTALEIVLGIDNIIFISILTGRLPEEQQPRARNLGLIGAMGTRILLLLSISWIMQLIEPLFQVGEHAVSGRDLILLSGGVFLIYKATREIHDKLEGTEEDADAGRGKVGFGQTILQIAVLDIVFSLDSVITAVGMAEDVVVMIIAVVLAVGVMLLSAGRISAFVEEHPTIKMLALSFLLMVGFTLVVEGMHVHVPKGYVYFAMGFSVFVEMLNLRAAKRRKERSPIRLRSRFDEDDVDEAQAEL
ncbi:MAG: TerC family protein [Alphaproteobacteria bacterium]|nr:TerC family protein [Alphaproteobacteria bacterium]